MEQSQQIEMKELKTKIIRQMAVLSGLLGEIPSDHQSVKDARDSFLALSVLISRALEIDIYG